MSSKAVPTLYVNGEKYDFSEEVIIRGVTLYKSFVELFKTFQRAFMKKHYTLGDSEFELISLNLGTALEEFDQLWTRYEDKYVRELMIIESQSRRFISEGIAAEAVLAELELNNRKAGEFHEDPAAKQRLNHAHLSFAKILAKVNSVANYEGHGRDDLGVEILHAANDALLKVTACESQNLRRLAEKILASYQNLRDLLRKYRDNIEVVDPQLRNNPDLVEALVDYEKCWEKGKIYLLNAKRCDQLIYMTNVIEGLCEKYPPFKESLECCDAEVFVQIPMILLLKRVDREDSDICEVFLPQISESESSAYELFGHLKNDLALLNDRFTILKERSGNGVVRRYKGGQSTMGRSSISHTNNAKTDRENSQQTPQPEPTATGYKTLLKSTKPNSETQKQSSKKLTFEFYNYLEKRVLTEPENSPKDTYFLDKEDTELLDKSVLNLRHLSIEMQRFNPMDWNAFLDIAISK